MAKAKKTETPTPPTPEKKPARPKAKPKPSQLEYLSTTDEIIKKYGAGVVITGQDILEQEKQVIGLSPALDSALGGGLQEGSLVVISGPPRCGKSTTCLHFAGKCQRMGRRPVYVNAEHRAERRDLNGIPGLDASQIDIIQSRRGKILSAQDYLSIVESYLTQETGLLIIIDSISIMCDESEMTNDLGTYKMGGTSKLVSSFCKRMCPVIMVNNHIVICIAHLYANLNPQGRKWLEAIGGKVDYTIKTKMRTEFFKSWTIGSGDKETEIGQEIHWKIDRSPLGPPNRKAISWHRYGHGLDEVYENIKVAETLPFIIEKGGGGNYTLNFMPEPVKIRGAESLITYFEENPDSAELLDKAVKEAISE
jgi:RecA/RadA recombinase